MPRSPVHIPVDGAKVRERRKRCGLTQAAFAQEAGICPSYASLIETGRRQMVTPPTFVRICDALGLLPKEREQLIRDTPAAEGDGDAP